MKYKVELFRGPISTAIVAEELEECLNEFSKDGWELINIVPQTESNFNSSNGPEAVNVVEYVDTLHNVLVFRKQPKIKVEV